MPLPVSNDPVTDQGRLYVSPSLPVGDGGLPIAPVADPDAAAMANVPTDGNVNEPNVATRVINKLLGTGGEERYKTWPEKLLRDALSAPHDVLNSSTPSTSGDLIKSALDMSALAGTGGLGGVGEGGAAALGSSPFLRPALKYEGKIYKAPVGGEHMDAIPETLRPEFTKQAMSGEDISNFNFGFMNHKGQFLDREKALKYAIDEGLLSPHDAKYGALTSTMDLAKSHDEILNPPSYKISGQYSIDPNAKDGFWIYQNGSKTDKWFSTKEKAQDWLSKNQVEDKYIQPSKGVLDSMDLRRVLKNNPTLMANSSKEAAALKLAEDYRGQHTAADAESGSPLHDVTANGTYPKDFYGPNGLKYYAAGHEDNLDAAAYSKILNFKDKPDELVKIYRAIPWEGKKPATTLNGNNERSKINPGDWVTISKQYAKDHGESALNGKYAIADKRVPAKELFTSGDSFHEWGWSPQAESK